MNDYDRTHCIWYLCLQKYIITHSVYMDVLIPLILFNQNIKPQNLFLHLNLSLNKNEWWLNSGNKSRISRFVPEFRGINMKLGDSWGTFQDFTEEKQLLMDSEPSLSPSFWVIMYLSSERESQNVIWSESVILLQSSMRLCSCYETSTIARTVKNTNVRHSLKKSS